MCAACERELPWLGADACPQCALPGTGGVVCGRCQRTPPGFDATRAVFEYRFPVDRLVHALKYRQRLAVSSYFSALFVREALQEFAACGIDVVLPVPLHRQRLRERGFNQALELARPLAHALGLEPATGLVVRSRNVARQADLAWSERQANVAASFGCVSRLDGLHVLVIDDVMTTGATLDALAVALKAAGAARVHNLVVARTPPPGSIVSLA